MAGGDVKLKIGADTSELEKAFSNFIKKAQGDVDKLKLSPGAAKAAPAGAEAVREAAQTSRNITQRVREEKAGLDLINRELEKKRNLIEAIAKRQESMTKGSNEELMLIQKLNREKERLHQTERVAQVQRENFRRAEEASNRATGAGRGPGGGGGGGGGLPIGAGGVTSPQALARLLGVSAGTLGLLTTGVAAGSSAEGLRKYFSEAKFRATETEASAFQMQGQGGQRIQSILGGNAIEESIFDPLRQQAAKNAETQMRGRLESSFRIFTRPLQTIFGRARNGYEAGNQFGLGTDAQKREIDAEQQKERATEQAKQFEALKTGPEGALRTAVANQYIQTFQRNLDFQRQMGLGTSGFRTDFLGGINSAGFTNEQGMGMASGIMGAGGSTRSAVGNAGLALQAQRNLDMTNAGGVIGTLSKGLGSAETTKEAFVKILAEGTRAGLDGSEFREENRKFTEAAAGVITQSGVTTAGGADQILGQFGKFFGDRTGTGMEAGKNAFETYRETSMAQTGPRGTMRAAGMLTNPVISKLDRDSREALFNMPIDQLTPDNPAIIAMARQANVSPEQLIEAQNKVTSQSSNLFKKSDIATRRLANVKKKYNLQSSIGFQGPLSANAYEEISAALGESNIAQIREHPEFGQNQRVASAYSEAQTRGDGRSMQQALEQAKQKQLTAPTTGRPEDETNRLQAEASRLSNQLFMNFKDSITPADQAVKNFANSINTLVDALKRGVAPGQAINAFNSAYPGAAPTTVPSAGAPSSGGGSGQ